MISKTFSLLFFLRKAKNRTQEAAIFLRITVDRQRTELSVKRFCDPQRWNSNTGRLNGTKEDARTLNAYLDTLQSKVYEIHRKLIEANQPVTAEAIKNKFTGVTERPRLLLELFLHHNQQMKKLVDAEEYAKGTLVHFNTTYAHVHDFIQWKFNQKDIDIKRINYEFIADLEFFLKTGKKCAHNSTMKYLGDFKKIVLLCVKNDWLPKDPFMGYKLSRKEVIKEFLMMEELEVIIAKQFASARLSVVRDIFLFSCYTGLAYVDVKKLKRSEIRPGIDGHKWLFIQRQKSDTPAPIPLLPVCLKIIEQYKTHPKCVEKNMVLPILSNQKMNEYLKEIAAVCSIDKVLTYHLARHTFATTVTLNNNVPIESVSKMLGHRNLKTTQHYAKILNKKVSEDMQVLRSKFEKMTEETKLKAI